MIVAGSASPLLLSSAGGYNLTNSLRFRSSASAYLDRTLTTPTNSQKFTFSDWVKRGSLASNQFILQAGNSVNDEAQWYFTTSDTIRFYQYTGSYQYDFTTAQVFRDPSAWYHIVVQYDSTESTTANRFRVYVNGSQITLTASTNVTLNATNSKVNSAVSHDIGGSNIESRWFDGYMTEINFIDGQALTPSSFGQTSTTTGVWIPKKYTGTYGTNGFYLPFTNTASTSTLGNDFSGNSNTWTVNNISLTAGSTYDSMTDVPTLTSATAANYAVINPLIPSTNTISNGNLKVAVSTSPNAKFVSTIGVTSGKYYMEIVASTWSNSPIGVSSNTTPQAYLANSDGSTSVAFWLASGGTQLYVNAFLQSWSGSATTWATNDVAGLALDATAKTIALYKNGSLVGTYDYSALGWSEVYFAGGNYVSSLVYECNFGQRPFAYTPPTGFNRLNTFNLPTPTIGATASTQAGKYFNPVLYTGNGGTQTVSGVGFQPDLTWVKDRSAANSHWLNDAVRGAGLSLASNTNEEEKSYAAYFTAFNSNGFALAGGTGGFNANGDSYVAWNWKANGAGSSNTAGSITSTVSANTTAGFSVVTWTGQTSGSATIGHGLGVAPSVVLVKGRNDPGQWWMYHSAMGNTQYIWLNNTSGSQTGSGTNAFANTAPTSTVFTVGTSFASSSPIVNWVAYCFAQVAGYSAFGSYTGNGSSDGPFVYLGFRPRFVMVKCSSSDQGGNAGWGMFDTSRNAYNVANNRLIADLSNSESTSPWLDINSNGFKIRETSTSINGSGATYIYMAFAETPLKFSNAR
jgi:hypothetical protein